MATRERRQLEQLIKSWAQAHTSAYIIADSGSSDQGINKTSGYLTWLIQEKHAHLDLLNLVDRVELYLKRKRERKIVDGMFCKICQSFYEFAESNQEDGSLICYSCRTNPYH